jgi:hypothetical protein
MTTLAPVLAAPELIRVDDGRIHVRYRVDNRWVKDERCNLGLVKLTVATLIDVENADPKELCDYCFEK